MPLAAGTWLDSFKIVAQLGEGGMGEVYHARDAVLKRDVAIKVLREYCLAIPSVCIASSWKLRPPCSLQRPRHLR